MSKWKTRFKNGGGRMKILKMKVVVLVLSLIILSGCKTLNINDLIPNVDKASMQGYVKDFPGGMGGKSISNYENAIYMPMQYKDDLSDFYLIIFETKNTDKLIEQIITEHI